MTTSGRVASVPAETTMMTWRTTELERLDSEANPSRSLVWVPEATSSPLVTRLRRPLPTSSYRGGGFTAPNSTDILNIR